MAKKPATDGIRDSILGADRPFLKVLPGGRGGGPTAGPADGDDDPCPVTALGDSNGTYWFLDTIGQVRSLNARQLGNRHEVRGLFRGDEAWLRRKFPEKKEFDGENGEKVTRIVGFILNAAAAWLQKLCSDQGLYGSFLQLRRPGIWRGEDGLPVVHCGDQVLMEGDWRPAGLRTGNQVWIAAPPEPRPDTPCGKEVAVELQLEIQRLWRFRNPGGEGLLVGWIGAAMLGMVARHRPNAFFMGEGGSGKSMLMTVIRSACPMHSYSNDASAAGVMSAMNGRVMPIFIDESSDRANQDGAGALMDLVLASATGEGVKGIRGMADGGSRTVEMAGCVLYGSVNPPPMQATHMGRVTLLELLKPEGGEDRTAEHIALAAWAKLNGPALWGRAIAASERWQAAQLAIRACLAEAGCAAREMDQMGALLAGWWVLTHEGLPGEAGAREAVGMASAYIRPAADIVEESGPRRAVQHLMATLVQYDGTTRREQIGTMIRRLFEPSEEFSEMQSDSKALERYGIRVIAPCLSEWEWRDPPPPPKDQRYAPEEFRGWVRRRDPEVRGPDEPCQHRCCRGVNRKAIPRLGDSGGIWLAPVAARSLYHGQPSLDGDRWQTELLRLGTRPKQLTVRIGGVSGKAIWLPREVVDDD